jgi:5-methylcytosine-specific restriction endonuclease McrA
MDAATRAAVRRRAGNRCEYCRLLQENADLPHHIEHIVPKQHRGTDEFSNLALACQRCNLNKGPNLTGIDPASGAIAPLFHPRRDRWEDHFHFQGVWIEGRTASGRATVSVLGMNENRRLNLRWELADKQR